MIIRRVEIIIPGDYPKAFNLGDRPDANWSAKIEKIEQIEIVPGSGRMSINVSWVNVNTGKLERIQSFVGLPYIIYLENE